MAPPSKSGLAHNPSRGVLAGMSPQRLERSGHCRRCPNAQFGLSFLVWSSLCNQMGENTVAGAPIRAFDYENLQDRVWPPRAKAMGRQP